MNKLSFWNTKCIALLYMNRGCLSLKNILTSTGVSLLKVISKVQTPEQSFFKLVTYLEPEWNMIALLASVRYFLYLTFQWTNK